MGKQFEKGVSGNPNGRPKGTTLIPPELEVMNAKLISDTIAKYFDMDIGQLQEVIRHPETKMLDVMVCKIMYEAARKGDQAKMNALFERMVGKVAEKVDHTSSDKSMSPQVNFYIPDNKRAPKTEEIE